MRIFFISAILLWVRCAAFGDVEQSKPQATVFARTVKSEELFDRLTYPARVTPKVSTTILSETDGIVSKILAPLGQRVRKGQKIMTIRHTDPVYEYAPTPVFAPMSGVVSSVEVTRRHSSRKGREALAGHGSWPNQNQCRSACDGSFDALARNGR